MRSIQGGLVLSAVVGLCLSATALAVVGPPKAAPQRAAAPQPVPQAAKLTAAQIIEKHIAARGGTQAWHSVQSMSWNGKMEVGYSDSSARSVRYVSSAANAHKSPKQLAVLQADAARHQNDKQVQLPFLLEMKRPNKSRVEVEFDGKTAVQVYDGQNGWLLRPYLNRNDWEPFSAEQKQAQQDKWGLEDPLFDYVAQGMKVDLESVESVEGNAAYKLKLTEKNGDVRHIWIDAKSFLDVRVEGTPRRMDGRVRTVLVYQRDFRTVQGLMVPFVLETATDGYQDTHKMVIEKVAVNPRLDDTLFVKPHA
jgi:outer membrane lipoprotein-sorting protein